VTPVQLELAPGPQLLGWIAERSRSRSSPLDPLTLIVPTPYLGLHLRREMAVTGYANIRTTGLARLAESLGAERLAGSGSRPLTPSQDQAAIRRAIGRAPGSLSGSTPHQALIRTLQQLFRTFREQRLPDKRLDEVAQSGRMAKSAVAAYQLYRSQLEDSQLYDRTDLYESATAVVADEPGRLEEWGEVIALYLSDIAPVETNFLVRLGEQTVITQIGAPIDRNGDPPYSRGISAAEPGHTNGPNGAGGGANRGAVHRVLIASDAAQEVDAVVRDVLDELDHGLRLDRVAIVYRDRETYGALTRDTLKRAGVEFAGLDGRPLSASLAGQGLLTLLRIRDEDFARPAVVEWHGLLPHGTADWVPVADWERLSREAGVVTGVDQWLSRLDRLIDRLGTERDDFELREDSSEGQKSRVARRISMAQRMRDRIATIAAATEPPAAETWESLSGWAIRLLQEFVEVGRDWDEREQEAHQLIAAELEGLSAAAEVESHVNVGTFLATLTEVLDLRRQTEGRFGTGVIVGNIGGIRGMHFERVYLVGMTERTYPTPAQADPVLPLQEEADALGRRARHQAKERSNFEMAVLAAPLGGLTLSFPIWDVDTRPLYPSPWLLEVASEQEGRALQAAEVRSLGDRPWVTRMSAATAARLAPLNLANYRLLLSARTYPGRALAASPLALRADLPLRLNLRTDDGRRSDHLTEYDGCLADARGTSSLLEGGLGSWVVSPTAVEKWATCPFSYFLDRWLHVEPTELPEDVQQWSLNPLDRGSVLHDILEHFFGDLAGRGTLVPGYVYAAGDHELVERLALDAFAKLDAEGKTGLALAWQNEKAVLLQDLHLLLERDQEDRGPSLVPAYFEQWFGGAGSGSWPEVVIPVGVGRTVRLRGRIDRVDVAGADNPSHVRVIDYKSGGSQGAPKDEDPLAAGTKLQLAAYGKAVSTWLESKGLGGVSIDAAYWFMTTRGEFKLAQQRIDDRIAGLFENAIQIIDQSMSAGCFPQVPGGDTYRRGRSSWDNCIYCPFDRICPAARDHLHDRKQADPVAAEHGRLAIELGPDGAGDP
jgi:ATP-dependent helicase/nuclease subunit B